MTILDEFEKDFQDRFHDEPECCQPKVVALWAAKWMAERCAKEIESRKEWTNHDIFCETPRQLAQELSR